jgi:hypothetical protein
MPEPRGTWEVKCVNSHLFYDDEVGRLLVERAAPKRHPVNLRRMITGLPCYLRKQAEIVSCFHSYDPELRTSIVRGKSVGHDGLDTSPAWFVHAFMGHDVRGDMIVVPLSGSGTMLVPKKLNDQNSSIAYRAVPPAIVISPETPYMFRLFAQPECWARYRTDSERTAYVHEHVGYRVCAKTMDNVTEMSALTRNRNEFLRLNTSELRNLIDAYGTKRELAVSVHVLARMEAQARQ